MKKLLRRLVTILSFLGFLNLKRDKLFGRISVTRWFSIRNILIFPVLYLLSRNIPGEILLKGAKNFESFSTLLTQFFRDIVKISRINKVGSIVLYIFMQFVTRKKVAKFIKILFRICEQNILQEFSPQSNISAKIFITGIILNFILDFFVQHKVNLFGLISFLYINMEIVFIFGYIVTVSSFLTAVESILHALNQKIKISRNEKPSRKILLTNI